MIQALRRSLIGRRREFAELTTGLDDVLAGRGRLFLLAGEAGIGKTRLAIELAECASARDARVLWGRCREEEGAPAYWPWAQILRTLLRQEDFRALPGDLGPGGAYLGEIVPELRQLGASPAPPIESPYARHYLFDSIVTLLRIASEIRPVLLILDDLQWADPSSLLLLRHMAGELREARVFTLVSYREEEARRAPAVAETLGDLARDGQRLPLVGLHVPDVAAWIEGHTGAEPAEDLVAGIHRTTEGNPFFIDELLRLLEAEGVLGDPKRWRAWSGRVPEGARQLIARRIEPLSEGCREMLRSAAIIGRAFDLAVLREAGGEPDEGLVAALDEALGAGLLQEEAGNVGAYAFSHGLVREALYEGLSHSRRLELHRRVGEAYQRLHGATSESVLPELAYHFLQAAPTGTAAKAVEYSRLAGERALAQVAYEESIRHFKSGLRALDLVPAADPGLRCDLWLALSEAERRSGDAAAARRSASQASELAHACGSSARRARAALLWGGAPGTLLEAYDASGRVEPELVEALQGALEAMPSEDGALRARLLSRLATALYWAPEARQRREQLSDEAVAMAERLGDAAELAAALTSRRYARWGPKGTEERLADVERILRLAERSGDRERLLQARQWRIWDLLELGDVHAADLEIEACRGLAAELRQPFYLGTVEMLRATRALMRGEFEAAAQMAAEALAIGLRAQNAVAPLLFGAQSFRAAWEQGRTEMLEAAAAGIREQADLPATRCALAFVLSELGRSDEARRELERLASVDFADLNQDLGWLASVALLARVCAALGDARRAEILYGLLAPHAGHNVLVGPPAADCFGPVDYFLGLLAHAAGRLDAAAGHLADAARRSRAMDAPPFALDAECEWAAVWLAKGQDGAARERLVPGLAEAKSLGLVRIVRRMEALLGGAGGVEPAASLDTANDTDGVAAFRREGDYWTISFAGRSLRLRDTRGLQYLAHLLRHRDREFHVADLSTLSAAALDQTPAAAARAGGELAARAELGHAGDVLDARARASYKERLDELRAELEQATEWGDRERAARLREEVDFLTAELAGAFGIGGRARRGADTAERARKAVTNRLRDAIGRIAKEHPALGLHLENAIKMGTFCVYQPERPPAWTF